MQSIASVPIWFSAYFSKDTIDWWKGAIDCINANFEIFIILLFWEIYEFNFYQISLASLSKVNKIFSWIFMHEKIFLSTKIIKVKIFIYLCKSLETMNLTRDLLLFFCYDLLLINFSSSKLIFGEAWFHILPLFYDDNPLKVEMF